MKNTITNKLFWLDTAERAVKTFAQTAIATLSAGSTGLLNVDWPALLSVAGLAALLSVLTSVVSAGSGNSASLVVDNVKEKK